MDMNQLFHHHQIALMVANRTRREGGTLGGFDLVRHYAKRINRFRKSRGLQPDFTGYNGHTPSV